MAAVDQAAKHNISVLIVLWFTRKITSCSYSSKIVNKDLTVIVNTGDGDSYGEGVVIILYIISVEMLTLPTLYMTTKYMV